MGRPRLELPIDALLAELRAGASLDEACRRHAVPPSNLRRRVYADRQLAARVADAKADGLRLVASQPRHGARSCDCAECRFAHTVDQTKKRPAKRARRCPSCGRRIGVNSGGRLNHHYASPGVICDRGLGEAAGR